MIATAPAIQPVPGLLAGRPAVAAAPRAVAVETATELPAGPHAGWASRHRTFRGTRIFTGLVLGWAGLVLASFGAFAVPAANALGRSAEDAGLMGLLGMVAPWLVVLGVFHVIAAVGIGRDRAWGFRIGTWALAIGVFVVLAAIIFTVAGRDPFLLADPASSPAANGGGLHAWTMGLYALTGWGMRRTLAARGLL
jgi:hypothetical protein